MLQRFIVALLTESCLIELGGKYFGIDPIKQLEIDLHGEYDKEIKILYIEFLNAMLKCVESYEDDRASELASMIDDIINPLITEQYKLLSLMREQIINATVDIEDIEARMKSFDARKQKIAAAIAGQS